MFEDTPEGTRILWQSWEKGNHPFWGVPWFKTPGVSWQFVRGDFFGLMVPIGRPPKKKAHNSRRAPKKEDRTSLGLPQETVLSDGTRFFHGGLFTGKGKSPILEESPVSRHTYFSLPEWKTRDQTVHLPQKWSCRRK